MSMWKRKLRFCQPLDIYTGHSLPIGQRTIEHIIPQSILKKVLGHEEEERENESLHYRYNGNLQYNLKNHHLKNHRNHYPSILNDPLNLFVTSSVMNSFRSNYKYGVKFQSPSILILDKKQNRSPDVIQMDIQRNNANRTFYPITNQRLLGHTILNMYRRYPRLEEKHNEIFAEENLLEKWLKQPWIERERNMLQWKWLVFGEKSI